MRASDDMSVDVLAVLAIVAVMSLYGYITSEFIFPLNGSLWRIAVFTLVAVAHARAILIALNVLGVIKRWEDEE